MANFILILNRIFNLYMYYVGIACLLSWIPNINPDYPLFHIIFVTSGFYLISPVAGFVFAPVLIMAVCALISDGLFKWYLKLTESDSPKVVVLTPEEFFEKFGNGSFIQHVKQDLTEQNSEEKEKENNNDSI